MVGARDMAFPKANALSYWMLPLAVLLVAINPLLGGFDSGWTAYPPLSQQANLGQQAYIMAFVTVGVSLDPELRSTSSSRSSGCAPRGCR